MAGRETSYCTYLDVRGRLSGDNAGALSPSWDQVIADKCIESSRSIDRMIARCRGIKADWSFLADARYDSWLVGISARPAPTGGGFTLSIGGQVTSALPASSSAFGVQDALVSIVGADNVVVTGVDGGPWTITWDGSMSGDQGRLIGNGSTLEADGDASVTVQRLVTGSSEIYTERIFSALFDEQLMPIDDCVTIQTVRLISSAGATVRELSPVTDFRAWPLSGSPTEGLKSLVGDWPEWPYSFGVLARWGYGLQIPADVREATIIEVIRSYLSDRAGNDDRIGVSPLGSVMTSKAYTSKTWALMKDYAPSFGLIR